MIALRSNYYMRRDFLIKSGRGFNPSNIEMILGLICFTLIAFQLHFKWETNTIMFILNPCHAITVISPISIILNSLCSLHLELSLYYHSQNFRISLWFLLVLLHLERKLQPVLSIRWLGIVFAENEELSTLELFVYYVQHAFAALMAPMFLFRGGRYSSRDILIQPLPTFGFILFTLYMRYFLTPISAMTWVNLNHTLCGIDNDPWRVAFGMHKYFYFWADGYLILASQTVTYMNGFIAQIFCKDNPPYKTKQQ